MGDVILRAEDVEPCKENIMPLKEGRRTSTLKTILTNTKTPEDIEKERQSFEIRIQTYAGNDPLDLWVSYIEWTKTTFPSGGQSEVVVCLERCIQQFWSHEAYKQDSKFLKVLLQYGDLIPTPMELYTSMEQAQIGLQSTLFWKAYGRACEAKEDWSKAETIYQRGIDVLAKPIEMMKTIQTEFESRMFRRMKAEASKSASERDSRTQCEGPREDAENSRIALGSLRSTGSVRSYEQGPSHGLGASAASTTGFVSLANSKKRLTAETPLEVYEELESDRKIPKTNETFNPTSAPAFFTGTTTKENERTMEKWNDRTLAQDSSALAAANRVMKAAAGGQKSAAPIQVFSDPTLSTSSSTASSTNISKPNALKNRDGFRLHRGGNGNLVAGSSSFPYRFTFQSEYYPKGSNEPTVTSNGSLEKSAYDRTVVYPGDGKEYSFEEIRAKHLEATRQEQIQLLLKQQQEEQQRQQEQDRLQQQLQEDDRSRMEIDPDPSSISKLISMPGTPAEDASTPPRSLSNFEPTQLQQRVGANAISTPEFVQTPISKPTRLSIPVQQQVPLHQQFSMDSQPSYSQQVDSPVIPRTPVIVSRPSTSGASEQFNLISLSTPPRNPKTPQFFTDHVSSDELIGIPPKPFEIFQQDPEDQESPEAISEQQEGELLDTVSTPEPQISHNNCRKPLQPRLPGSISIPKASNPPREAFRDDNDENRDPLQLTPLNDAVVEQSNEEDEGGNMGSPQSKNLNDVFLSLSNATAMTPQQPPQTIIFNKIQDRGTANSLEEFARTPVEIMSTQSQRLLMDENQHHDSPVMKLRKGLSVVNGEDPHRPTIATLAQTLGSGRKTDDGEWEYDPDRDTSGFTMRTKAALPEVLNLFKFEDTMSIHQGNHDQLLDSELGVEVTSSIAVPFMPMLHKAKMVNNFEIFQDEALPATPKVMNQDAVFGNQQIQPMIVFDDGIRTQKEIPEVSQSSFHQSQQQQPFARKGLGNRTDLLEPTVVPSSAPIQQSQPQVVEPQIYERNDSFFIAQTPTRPSQGALQVTSRVCELTRSPAFSKDETTSTITLSGITASGLDFNDTTSFNTGKLNSIIQKQQQQGSKRNGHVSHKFNDLIVLPVQLPMINASENVIDLSKDITLKSSTQLEQLEAIKGVGLSEDKNLIDCTTTERNCPVLMINQSYDFPKLSFTVLSSLNSSQSEGSWLAESDSGSKFVLQTGSVYDYYICKRIFTKLHSNGSHYLEGTTEEDIEELKNSVVDFSHAFVFNDQTLVAYPYKSDLHKTTFLDLIAHRQQDTKSIDEVLSAFYTSKLLKIVSSLNRIGFVCAGTSGFKESDFWVFNPFSTSSSSSSSKNPSSSSNTIQGGIILRQFTGIVDLESYKPGIRFTSATPFPSTLYQILNFGSSWTNEYDFAFIAEIAHALLHGKPLEVVPTSPTTSAFKTKTPPKLFWQTKMWNHLFEMTLNQKQLNQEMVTRRQLEVQVQLEQFLQSKCAQLRFQIEKLKF